MFFLNWLIKRKFSKAPKMANQLLNSAINKNLLQVKTKIKTTYRQNKFQFDIKIKMPVGLNELLFTYDVSKNGAQLEKIIAKQIQMQFESLIKKIQEHKIDKPYKEVEDHWGEALANADIHISVNVSIGSMGPILYFQRFQQHSIII